MLFVYFSVSMTKSSECILINHNLFDDPLPHLIHTSTCHVLLPLMVVMPAMQTVLYTAPIDVQVKARLLCCSMVPFHSPFS